MTDRQISYTHKVALVTELGPSTTIDPLGAEHKPRAYYVIAGRGPAAICNHATLRQSDWGRKRIGDLPVMHIGFPDPWAGYSQHDMGQPPHLLGFPGFAHPVDGRSTGRAGRCHSTAFADATEAEWQRLAATFGDSMAVVEGTVLWVQNGMTPLPTISSAKSAWKEFPDEFQGIATFLQQGYPAGLSPESAPYRLAVMFPTGTLGLVYATYVDFCTGPGRPRPLPLSAAEGSCPPPWVPPSVFWAAKPNKTMMSGNDALLASINWKAHPRVACYGAGGVGLNMVERAEDEGIGLDWISHESLLQAGMILPDNVAVLRDRAAGLRAPLTKADPQAAAVLKVARLDRTASETAVKRELIEQAVGPVAPTVRFIRNAPLKEARIANGQVQLEMKEPLKARCVDADEPPGLGVALGPLASVSPTIHYAPYSPTYGAPHGNPWDYDRFIWTIGQDPEAVGTAIAAADHLGLAEYSVPRIGPASKGESVTVGVASADQNVRLLGACVQANSPRMGFTGAQNTVAEQFYNELPVTAVEAGLLYSGINIALANCYFTTTRRNPNVNTMSRQEMIDLLISVARIDERTAITIAHDLIGDRIRNNGFKTRAEFWAAARLAARRLSGSVRWRFAAAFFPRIGNKASTTYPAAEPYSRP